MKTIQQSFQKTLSECCADSIEGLEWASHKQWSSCIQMTLFEWLMMNIKSTECLEWSVANGLDLRNPLDSVS